MNFVKKFYAVKNLIRKDRKLLVFLEEKAVFMIYEELMGRRLVGRCEKGRRRNEGKVNFLIEISYFSLYKIRFEKCGIFFKVK